MFNCGYCGKEFKTLAERCKCEVNCGEKQEEENKRKKQNELNQIKQDRDDEIRNAARCLLNQIKSFHSDYKERCSIELSTKYNSNSDYIWLVNLLRNSRIL